MTLLKEGRINVFIIGICGIGVSAIAKYLSDMGFCVSGSDISGGSERDILENYGIKVYSTHEEENVKRADIVIYSSAVRSDNPELVFARKKGIPVFSRAETLSFIRKKFPVSIGVAGAHGKTTTTSLIANILSESKIGFTAFIGGYDRNCSNYYNSGGEVFLTEVCEYKKNIDRFDQNVGVILNIDNDHLDCYKDLGDLIDSFRKFSLRSDYRIGNAEDNDIDESFALNARFGIEKGDYFAENIKEESGYLSFTVKRPNKKPLNVKVRLRGKHNVYNVLAAVAAVDKLNLDDIVIERGLEKFNGVKRRDEFLGELFGAKVFADYAHHPKEIEKYLNNFCVRDKKVHVLFQPHTFSRTKILFDYFVKVLSAVEDLIVYRTFSAREEFDEAGSAEKLAGTLKNSLYCDNFNDLILMLKNKLDRGDTLLVVGAGDIYDQLSDYVKKMRY